MNQYPLNVTPINGNATYQGTGSVNLALAERGSAKLVMYPTGSGKVAIATAGTIRAGILGVSGISYSGAHVVINTTGSSKAGIIGGSHIAVALSGRGGAYKQAHATGSLSVVIAGAGRGLDCLPNRSVIAILLTTSGRSSGSYKAYGSVAIGIAVNGLSADVQTGTAAVDITLATYAGLPSPPVIRPVEGHRNRRMTISAQTRRMTVPPEVSVEALPDNRRMSVGR